MAGNDYTSFSSAFLPSGDHLRADFSSTNASLGLVPNLNIQLPSSSTGTSSPLFDIAPSSLFDVGSLNSWGITSSPASKIISSPFSTDSSLSAPPKRLPLPIRGPPRPSLPRLRMLRFNGTHFSDHFFYTGMGFQCLHQQEQIRGCRGRKSGSLVCNRMLKSLSTAYSHYYFVHLRPKNFRCPFCFKWFVHRRDVNKHMVVCKKNPE